MSRSPSHKSVWALQSEYIRRKYADKNGYVACYTCGVIRHWEEMQCGHFIHGRSLDYEENNLRPQCLRCNYYDTDRKHVFAIKMFKEIGQDRIDLLAEQKRRPFKDTPEFLQVKAEELREKINDLEADMISAKEAQKISDKNSPEKSTDIIKDSLDRIDKQIRRVSKKSGKRHINFLCDNEDVINSLDDELTKAGYRVKIANKMLKIEW